MLRYNNNLLSEQGFLLTIKMSVLILRKPRKAIMQTEESTSNGGFHCAYIS